MEYEVSYNRMILGTIVLIVFIAVAIVTYTVVVMPLEYTVDSLQNSYVDVAADQGWSDGATVSNTMGLFPWFLAGALLFFILLMFLWFFVYAQKKEFES